MFKYFFIWVSNPFLGIFLYIFFCVFNVLLAQEMKLKDTLKTKENVIDTNVIQILNEKNINTVFSKKLKLYKDATKKMSFEEIRKKDFNIDFGKNIVKILGLDTVHWVKWEIISQLPYDTEKILRVGNCSDITVYIEYKTDSITIQQTGKQISASKRSILMFPNHILVHLPKNQKITLWVKCINYDVDRAIYFRFGDSKDFFTKKSKDTFKESILQGALMMIFLYNLILWFVSKDITYFFYLGYIFISQTILSLSAIPENFFVGEYLRYYNYIFFFLLGNIGIWYMLFVRNFNQTYKYSLVLDKWSIRFATLRFCWIFMVIGLYAGNVLSFIIVSWIITITVIVDILFGIFIVMNQSKEEKNKPIYKYITYGSMCLFIGGGLSTLLPVLQLNNEVIIFGWSFAYFEIGLFAQLSVFSIGLSIRGQNLEKEKQIAQAQLIAELEKNEKLIKEQNEILEQKVTQRTKDLNNTLALVEQERQKSDTLLLNILPAETAQELKETGQFTPKGYKLVTVLFTDFKGFTQIAEKLSPKEVIENLNTCFLAFDEICEKYNLEKIKTIGDAYMCAGGLPIANETNPINVVKAGLEMQVWMQNWKLEKQKNNQNAWELRLGIHSGEVIAGVVGKKKFVYDIWGDTVNLASRMESSGEIGQVNISETTYQLVKNEFQCTFRGKIQAKNKGEINMYFVEN